MSDILNEYISRSEDGILDNAYGMGYRCSVDLIDGTHLPWVMLRRPKTTVELALRRFEDERKGRSIFLKKGGYKKTVQNFVASGNCVNSYDIANVTNSRFAIPKPLLELIEGETMMSWTGWVFEMVDGALFSYGSTFLFDFFQLPNHYEFSDVVKIHNHSCLDDDGNVRLIRESMDGILKYRDTKNSTLIYRERPYFTCFVSEK